MPTFHRFVDPAWTAYVAIPPGPGTSQAQPASGGLVYDRINISSGATGGAGSAFVNPPPPVGPTPFTYFVGFDDLGYSGNVNRGLAALGENTDFLDDVVHKDIGIRDRTFIATPLLGPAVTDYTFPPGLYVWLGSGPETFDDLFTITNVFTGGVETPDVYFMPSVNSELKVVASTSAIGSGFVNGPVTVTFNTATLVPPFSDGILIHFRRLTNAVLSPPDTQGPYPNGIDGNVARFLYFLDGKPEAYGHSTWYVGADVGAAVGGAHSLWKSNHYGLNQMLLRNTDPLIDTVPTPIAYMTPNAANAVALTQPGFWGKRDSVHRHSPMMVSAQSQTVADFQFLDPVNALWTAWMEDVGDLHHGGSSGFVVYGQRRMTHAAFDVGAGATKQGAGYASFLHLSNHPQSGIAPGGTYTFIPQDSAAVVGNVGPEARIDLTPNFFAQNVAGEFRSGVARGYDLIEVQFTPGAPPQTFVIVDFFSEQVAVIQNLDGTVPTFVGVVPCTVRWRSMVYGVSDGAAGYDIPTISLLKFDGLFYAAPHQIDPTNVPQNAARNDYAAKLYAINEVGDTNALAWGGFRATSTDFTKVGLYYDSGVLRGDGACEARKFPTRTPTTTLVQPADVTLNFAVDAAFSDYHEYEAVGPANALITTITSPSLNITSNDIGRVIRWVIRHTGSPLQVNPAAWPFNFVFENVGDDLFSNVLNWVDIYTGVVTKTATGIVKIFMSVNRYLAP